MEQAKAAGQTELMGRSRPCQNGRCMHGAPGSRPKKKQQRTAYISVVCRLLAPFSPRLGQTRLLAPFPNPVRQVTANGKFQNIKTGDATLPGLFVAAGCFVGWVGCCSGLRALCWGRVGCMPCWASQVIWAEMA